MEEPAPTKPGTDCKAGSSVEKTEKGAQPTLQEFARMSRNQKHLLRSIEPGVA